MKRQRGRNRGGGGGGKPQQNANRAFDSNGPDGVKVRGKETVVKSAKAFAEHYDGIMTAAITKAVVNQKYDDLFVNDQGVMFGDGQVWVNGICHDNACKNFDVKVIAIQDGPK